MIIQMLSRKELNKAGLPSWIVPPIAVPVLFGAMILVYALYRVLV